MFYCNPSISRELVRLQLNPRLAFNEVTARVFPLKASMNRLQDFCDNYLNFVDEEKCNRPTHYFKAAVPWVYCEVLNYGQMATLTQNLGWIAQHEIFFLVPLEWYVIKQGKLVFKDWAMVCPFTFVDNAISLTTGREVYGWSKIQAWLDRVDPKWADDPRNPRQLIDMRAELFPRAYAGEALEPRTLLQITQDPPPSVFRNPLGKHDMFGPAWSIPEALRNSVGLVADGLEFLTGWPLKGYDPRSLPATRKMLALSALNVSRMFPWWQLDKDTTAEAEARAKARGRNYYLNQITLKQFRDAAEPQYACYQALVNSRITIDHFYDGGLLGAANVALGDMTGGLRLRLHDYPEVQIQSMLGLEVEKLQESEGHEVAVLLPELPFWAKYDLRYDNGDVLCWRSKTSDWHCDPCPDRVPKTGRANFFNTSRGAGTQELYGPFIYPDVTVRVFPLKANKASLQQYCDEYLNRHGDELLDQNELPNVNGNRFEPWGEHVFMLMVTHSDEHGVAFSEHNNIGPISGNQIIFYVPVVWYRQETGPTAGPASGPSTSVPPTTTPLTDGNKNQYIFKLGVLTPYVFGTSRQTVAEREVNGIPSRHGDVSGGPDIWLNTFRGKKRSVLAELKTLLMSALDVGQPAREETLIEVVDVPPLLLEQLEAIVKSAGLIIRAIKCFLYWVNRLYYWVDRFYHWLLCYLFGLCAPPPFLAFIATRPLNYITLKQVRSTSKEAGRPVNRTASYQSIVLIEKAIEELFDGTSWVARERWGYQRFAEQLSKNIRIDIRYHETMDIAGILGLEGGKNISEPGCAPVQEFRPHNPFQIRLQLAEKLGHNVMTRVHGGPWETDDLVGAKTLGSAPNMQPPTTGQKAELKSLAATQPYKLIRNYLKVFALRTGCFRWL